MNIKEVSLDHLSEQLYSAVICDALDSMGYRNQSPNIQLASHTSTKTLVGRCKTTLWADMYHEDLDPYALELKAVDSCQPGEVMIAAAGGSMRSGIWGELLTTAAKNRGCIGAIVDGAIRDVAMMQKLSFPVFARGKSIYDSLHRQRVIDVDIPVQIGGVIFEPGALVFCDEDGIVLIPLAVEEEAISRALRKVNDENITRDAIRSGMMATEAYEKYGVL